MEDMQDKRGVTLVAFKKGAEARLFRGTWLDWEALYKIRTRKPYRHHLLDEQIRRSRTVNEARILDNLACNGIPVPTLYEVDLDSCTIIMEYINGKSIKDSLENGAVPSARVFKEFGIQVARIHNAGIVHGDITTSNVLQVKGGRRGTIPRIIDFGLAMFSTSLEDVSMDIHLFKRVVTSTHAEYFAEIFPIFLEGYEKGREYSSRGASMDDILKRIERIETRGRYVKKNKRMD